MVMDIQAYTTDPEGSFTAWNAVAIGADAPRIMTELASLIDAHKTPDSTAPESGTASKTAVQRGRGARRSAGTVEAVWPKFRSAILGKFFRTYRSDVRGAHRVGKATHDSDMVREVVEGDATAVQDEDGVVQSVEGGKPAERGGEAGVMRSDDGADSKVEQEQDAYEEMTWSVEVSILHHPCCVYSDSDTSVQS
jgi:hypothetical protein